MLLAVSLAVGGEGREAAFSWGRECKSMGSSSTKDDSSRSVPVADSSSSELRWLITEQRGREKRPTPIGDRKKIGLLVWELGQNFLGEMGRGGGMAVGVVLWGGLGVGSENKKKTKRCGKKKKAAGKTEGISEVNRHATHIGGLYTVHNYYLGSNAITPYYY
jgi:hypothetical protein